MVSELIFERSKRKTYTNFIWHSGSSNGHSPVLNLSKSGGLDQGSTGDQSDRSEGHSPPPSIRDEEENISDDNVSDVDEREEKEEGMCIIMLFIYCCMFSLQCFCGDPYEVQRSK